MAEQLDWILSRRSIRKFSDRAVEDATVNLLLEAAMAAPSSAGTEPWRFIIIREAAKKKWIAAGLNKSRFLESAPVGILVCGDINAAYKNDLSSLLQSCAASIENILLLAQNIGLGACWVGIHPSIRKLDFIAKGFDLPGNIIPIAYIPVGFPAEKKSSRTRFKKKWIHIENW